MTWLDQLRLRSAYGASGVQPGATTSLQTFSAVTRAINTTTPGNATGADTPGLIANALGNPNLQPEKSAEFESGFESRMFNSAVDLDFTYYNKQTNDALIAKPIAARPLRRPPPSRETSVRSRTRASKPRSPRDCSTAAHSAGT